MVRRFKLLQRLRKRLKSITSDTKEQEGTPKYRPLAAGIVDNLFEEFDAMLADYSNFYSNVEDIALEELKERFSQEELDRLRTLQKQGELIPPWNTTSEVMPVLAEAIEEEFKDRGFDVVEKRIREKYLR